MMEARRQHRIVRSAPPLVLDFGYSTRVREKADGQFITLRNLAQFGRQQLKPYWIRQMAGELLFVSSGYHCYGPSPNGILPDIRFLAACRSILARQ
jgi:hypothetical protein